MARVVLAVGARGPPLVTYLFGSYQPMVHLTVPVTVPSTPDPIVTRVAQALGVRGSKTTMQVHSLMRTLHSSCYGFPSRVKLRKTK